jgi:hypothetical protein
MADVDARSSLYYLSVMAARLQNGIATAETRKPHKDAERLSHLATLLTRGHPDERYQILAVTLGKLTSTSLDAWIFSEPYNASPSVHVAIFDPPPAEDP